MSKLIKGTHHIALRGDNEAQLDEMIKFYNGVLGLEIIRTWGEGDGRGAMLRTGDSILELFAAGRVSGETGSVNHFALATDDTDGCVNAVKAAGYKVTMEPTDIVIASAVPFPARIAFCVGPVGEEIEFFCEK